MFPPPCFAVKYLENCLPSNFLISTIFFFSEFMCFSRKFIPPTNSKCSTQFSCQSQKWSFSLFILHSSVLSWHVQYFSFWLKRDCKNVFSVFAEQLKLFTSSILSATFLYLHFSSIFRLFEWISSLSGKIQQPEKGALW